MALSIRDEETERLARDVSARRGSGITEAIRDTLRRDEQADGAAEEHRFDVAVRRAQQMVRDGVINWAVTKDEILGYDANGIPEQH